MVVALVHECDPSAKPCRVASTGKAYLRGYDGDFQLSHLEEQAFIAARKPPMFDRAPVEGAVFSDLDPELVDALRAEREAGRARGAGQVRDRMELLRRACVITADNVPTVAGILAMGLYPQQFFPRFVIQAAAEPLPGRRAAARARNQAKIAGPIPHMLDQAMEWARRTFDTFIVTEADGSVHDRYAYPLVAFRELIANALIHRDLDAWSAGLAIEVRLRRDRLVIAQPRRPVRNQRRAAGTRSGHLAPQSPTSRNLPARLLRSHRRASRRSPCQRHPLGHGGSQGSGASACAVLRFRYPVHGHAEAAVPDSAGDSAAVRNCDTKLVGPRPADLRPSGGSAAHGFRTCGPDPAIGRYRPPKSPCPSGAGARPPAWGTRSKNYVSTGVTTTQWGAKSLPGL